jgi:drug/metabolite transporter (DMT)-like permease
MRRRVDPGLLLLLTPFLWGATFPATKIAIRTLPVPAFMAWSRTLGFLAIAALLPVLRRADPGDRGAARAAVAPAIILGVLMFVGYVLQTEGQARTTATNAGFITGLYVVFAPVLGAVLFRDRISRAICVAILLSLGGLTLLSVRGVGEFRVHAGDLLVLAGAVGWAGHITAVGYFSPRYPAWRLAFGQMGVAAALHLALSAGTGLRVSDVASASIWPLLFLTGVLGSGVAFTIQILGQQKISAARAVVLLAGEALVSAAFAAVWIGERLAVHQWLGAGLVLAAMAYSELVARRPGAPRLDPAAP